MATTVSAINWVKDSNGNYIATLPINTIDEVYYDIDKGIKSTDVLHHVFQYIQVTSTAEMYKLTKDDVVLGTIIKVTDTGISYRVINLDKLNVEAGYEIANGPNIVLPDDGKDESPVEIISYKQSDINT